VKTEFLKYIGISPTFQIGALAGRKIPVIETGEIKQSAARARWGGVSYVKQDACSPQRAVRYHIGASSRTHTTRPLAKPV